MATISKKIVDDIIASNGYYCVDPPRVYRVVEYTDMGGKLAYGIEYEHQIGKYSPSVFVHNPRIIWEADSD